MYCQTCGNLMQDGIDFCGKCGAPRNAQQQAAGFAQSPAAAYAPSAPSPVAPAEPGRFKTASSDAVEALKLFSKDPIGGMPAAYDRLNEPRAIGVGIAFAVIYILCWLAAIYIAASVRPSGLDGLFKFVLAGAVPFVSLLGASALARKLFNGAGSAGGDSFIAGAALLPFGLFVLLASILGYGNYKIISALFVFALCFAILILYTGCTRISKITEAKSSLAVPIMVLVSFLLMYLIYDAIIGFSMPGVPYGI